MQCYKICGAQPLRGETAISGAKNAALPILAACVLCRGPCVLHNCPDIADVETSLAILHTLGAKTARAGSTLVVDASGLTQTAIPAALAARMRSSVLYSGALLAAAGAASMPLPGGCPLGRRPIDYHLQAFQKLGAKCSEFEGKYEISWENPSGTLIELPRPSVGATENAILAALGCKGEPTVLKNAAMEPEILDFVNFLRSAGAEISGGGTPELHILGGKPLHGTTYCVQPDRIETATFLFATAGCGGDVLLKRTNVSDIKTITALLQQMGCELSDGKNTVRIRRNGKISALSNVKTAPYPGFPTDCQALLTAALLRANGESCIEETVFEERFHHIPELQKLGADLKITGNSVKIHGKSSLHGAAITAKDLRGGAALALAALQAEGVSNLRGLPHIDRGYEHFDQKLRALGANIVRTFAG